LVNVAVALEWIQAQQGNPWFAWVAFNAAHTPLHDPPPELTTIGPGGNGQAQHRAMVQAMDSEIIRLVTSMRLATRQRTWVIFVGDNGNPPSTLPLGGSQWPPTGKTKPNPWEGNVRVPLVVLGPTVDEPGREIADPLAGVPVPDTAADSISFAPRIRHADAPPRRDVAFGERFRPNGFGPYTRLQWYITDGRWKVGKYSLGGSQSLDPAGLNFYDLDADLEEATDLLNAPLNAEQQAAFDFLMMRRAEITQ
jgi:arylsulfatase A-like enzyme